MTDASRQVQRWTGRQWLVWSVLALMGLATAFWLQTQPPQRELFRQINQWASVYPSSFWSFLTLLGDAGILFVLLSPLLLWRPQAMMALLAAIPLGGLFSVSFKRLYDAPRPAAVLDLSQFHLIGPVLSNVSFPSGHTISAFAAAGAVLASLANTRKLQKSVLCGIMVVGIAVLVGLSRVAVGAHWPVDVLAGACGGWLAGLSGAWVAQRYSGVWQNRRNQRWLTVALAATGLWLVWRPIEYPLGALAVWLAVLSVVGTVLGQILVWQRSLSTQASH